ncbi:MAG: alpha/beta hydrolase [Desulfohalobiaceae bacterium]
MHQPDSTQRDHAWQGVSFANSLGQRLAGLFYACTALDSALIVCHGFSGSKEGGGRSLRMAEYLARPGMGVLLFDFSGNGESEGSFADTTLSGQMDDLKCAADWCLEAGAKRLAGMGRSFGGTTLLCRAAKDSRFGAVCIWATPVYPLALFHGFLREKSGDRVILAGEDGTIELDKAFLKDLASHDTEACARNIPPRPVLIVHGERDEVVPPHEARVIRNAAASSSHLHMIPEADHRFSTGVETVWELCRSWLEESFG